ncbi:MAG TPA: DUF302 domain-containing protein [Gemmatimonadaceae bacterium]|nr:DUF302 domain-containing protein [Gemmatimonadaceae bacterium]
MASRLVHKKSPHGAQATIDRLENIVRAAGSRVFARFDHTAGAASAGLALRPTVVLVFGNVKVGTPLIQEAQTIGLDLPLRVVAWEDVAGQVWLTYHEPDTIAREHDIPAGNPHVAALALALRAVTEEALRP